MTIREQVGHAWAALASHRLRAALSALGMTVGVATVMSAMAIGDGARQAALDEFGALGVSNIYILSTRAPESADAPSTLSLDDADAVLHRVARVERVAAVRSARVEVSASDRHQPADLIGVAPDWDAIVGVSVRQGRWLSERDERARRRVAVVGRTLATVLFPEGDPLGREVRVEDRWYHVVGVADARGTQARAGASVQRHDLSLAVLVPRSAMDVTLGGGDSMERVNEIAVRVTDGDHAGSVANAIADVLRRRIPGAPEYEIVVPHELLQARLRTQRTSTVVLFAISALALLISGVGIMNIMLVSVVERTQEVGVRRALGARRSDILAQFTIEAVLLCGASGLAGVPLGIGLSAVIALAAGWPVASQPLSMLLAVGLACATGLVCGIHPARLAARLDPAVALRAE